MFCLDSSQLFERKIKLQVTQPLLQKSFGNGSFDHFSIAATFTANLAAFLTVERMQTTVAGLEELAQQSKINYTVVEGSPYYEYFNNMASAEEDLYKKWKDMTLSR